MADSVRVHPAWGGLSTFWELLCHELYEEVNREQANAMFSSNIYKKRVAPCRELARLPCFDPMFNDDGQRLLINACHTHQPEIVEILLNHPKFNVNATYGKQTFKTAICCASASYWCANTILHDPRLQLRHDDLKSALDEALTKCDLVFVKLLVASGKHCPLDAQLIEDLDSPRFYTGYFNSEEEDRIQEHMLDLLRRLMTDPGATRKRIRNELSAHWFAVVIFLCDGLLELVDGQTRARRLSAWRFLNICRQLPMELQMTVCLRVVNSLEVSISSGSCEAAFVALSKCLP